MPTALTVTGIREEVKGVKILLFEGDEAKAIHFQAGQYLTLLYPYQQNEIRRSYSITSSPALEEPLAIGVKRIQNGVFSRYLVDDVRIGDRLLTTGAGGFFTLPQELRPYKQIFFFAAGSGITPVFSLLKTILYAHPQLTVVLIYSNSSPESTMFLEPLQLLAQEFSERLQIEFLFSNVKSLAKARLYRDLLRQLVKQYARAEPQELLCYLCGPENYMQMCVYGLRQLNVPAGNIRREYFTKARMVAPVKPADTNRHQVVVNFAEKQYHLQVQYPTTILEAAKKAGIALPYSCEVGRCGNCVARCQTGQVWMSYNEVLTERELAKGLVLTCVGFPIGGNVTLEI